MKEQIEPWRFTIIATLRIIYLTNILSLKSASLNVEPATTPTPNKYSFVVTGFKQTEGNLYQTCTGSLISKNVALYAGSCRGMVDVVMTGLYTDNPSAGELEEFNVSKEIVHYKFDPITLDYDFMLLELDGLSRYEPALLDDGRRSIATKSALSTEIFSIVGWVEPPSEEESYKLHVTNGAELVPSADCQAAYKNKLISGRMACYRSECHPGDRGSPILDSTSQKIISIVSWGDDCSNSMHAGVSARVSTIYHWVKRHVGEMSASTIGDSDAYHNDGNKSSNMYISGPEGRKGSKSGTKTSASGSSSSSPKSTSTGSTSKSSGKDSSISKSTSTGQTSKSSGKGSSTSKSASNGSTSKSSGKGSSTSKSTSNGSTSKSSGKGSWGCKSKSKSSGSKSFKAPTGCTEMPSAPPSSLDPGGSTSFPSQTPSASPTISPAPTDNNLMPSQSPSAVFGTAEPSEFPSAGPSSSGTAEPTTSPSTGPSLTGTAGPTASPSAGPTISQVSQSSMPPSILLVTSDPSSSPSAGPTTPLTPQPSSSPSNVPLTPEPSPYPSSSPSSKPSDPPINTSLYIPSTLQNSYNNETMFMEFLPEFDDMFVATITDSVSFLVDNEFNRRLQTSTGFQLTSCVTNITESSDEFCTALVSGGSCYEVSTEINVTHSAMYPTSGVGTLLSSIAQNFISEYGTYEGTALTPVEALSINVDIGGVLERVMDSDEQLIFQDALLDFLKVEFLFDVDPPIKVTELVLAGQGVASSGLGNSSEIFILSADIQLLGEHLPSMTAIDFQLDTIAAINEQSEQISDVFATSEVVYFDSVTYVSASSTTTPIPPAGSSSGLAEYIESPFAIVIGGAIVLFVLAPALIYRYMRRRREKDFLTFRRSASDLIGIKSRVAPDYDSDSKVGTVAHTHISDTSAGIFSFYLRPLNVQPRIDEESPACCNSNVEHTDDAATEGEGLLRKDFKFSSYVTGSSSDQDEISAVTEQADLPDEEDLQMLIGASNQIYDKIAALGVGDGTTNETKSDDESSP